MFFSSSTTFLANKKARFPPESSLHVDGSTPTSNTEPHAPARRRDRHPARHAHSLCGLIEVEHGGSLWRMPYICNDYATASTDLQSIPIFASFLRTKHLLRSPPSSIMHSRARRQGAFLMRDFQLRQNPTCSRKGHMIYPCRGLSGAFLQIWIAKHALTKEEVNESSIFEHAHWWKQHGWLPGHRALRCFLGGMGDGCNSSCRTGTGVIDCNCESKASNPCVV